MSKRSRSIPVLAATVFAALLLSTPVLAQEGFGIGVKGGLLFANFDPVVSGQSVSSIAEQNTGFQAGVWFGGNRAGLIGVMGEVNYLKKSAKLSGQINDIYALQVPVFLRVNVGSPSRNSVVAYVIGGPAVDVNLQSKLAGVDIKSQTEDFDISAIFGGGVEITRVIIEARYTKGIRNVAKNLTANNELKSHSVAVLVGIRFN